MLAGGHVDEVEVEVDCLTDLGIGPYRALTFAREPSGASLSVLRGDTITEGTGALA